MKKEVTRVGQQVGGQQAGEARVKQPGAFLDPSTRTPLGRTAWTRAGGGDGEREREIRDTESKPQKLQVPSNDLRLRVNLFLF